MRVITIPNGKRVSLGAYVKTWKLLKTLDPNEEVGGWEWFPVKVSIILRDISDGVMARTMSGVPRIQLGQ